MDLVSLILMCSLGAMPQTNGLVYQIAQMNDGDPTYIDDWSDGKVYTPVQPDEAAMMVSALLDAGHELRVGILQLPARQTVQSYGVSASGLIDSCQNIALGSDRLEQAIQKYPESITDALAWYFTGNPEDTTGKRWARAVLSVEVVALQEQLVDVEHPLPSRRYTPPKMLLFGEDSSRDSEKSPTLSQTLFPLHKNIPVQAKPSKWKSRPVKKSPGKKTKAAPTKKSLPKQPQSPVTDERLLTSDELKQQKSEAAQ